MPNYETLSKEITERIEADRKTGCRPAVGFADSNILRRRQVASDQPTLWRPAFVHDIDKILHCPYYNRKILQKERRYVLMKIHIV